MDGIEAAQQISILQPGVHIIALSMYDNTHYRQRMKIAAAADYVRKSQPINELIAAINSVTTRINDVADSSASEETHNQTSSALVELNALSEREREVLRLLAEGRRMTEIAASLHISQKTVETYRARLQQKLGIDELSGLVRFSIRSGLISPEI